MPFYLEHYGTPRHSGRYPWGSGENPYQSEDAMWRHIEKRRQAGETDEDIAASFLNNNEGFLRYIHALSQNGVSETDIAKQFGRSTTWLRQKKSIAVEQDKAEKVALALKLKEHGYSNEAIAEKIGAKNESTVRSLLARSEKRKETAVENTANALKTVMETHPYIDVGRGNSALLGVSDTRLGTAVQLLKDEGYVTHSLQVQQVGTGYKTTVKVLCPPGTTIQEAYDAMNNNKVATASGFKAENNGEKIRFMKDPVSLDPKRVMINYAEDGGSQKDGVIELRRGVEDLTLGANSYAQARILVGDDRYLKGMCVYADDLPDGVDVRFNTNKTKGTPFEKVLKEVKKDKDGNIIEENMFGAVITAQPEYTSKDGKIKQGVVNIVNEEGDWHEWSRTLSSQFLSKQDPKLIKERLTATYDKREKELQDILSVNNPQVKKKLLEEFGTECDSATVHLKAQGFDRQAAQVILPVTSLKDNEIYAPNFKDGERVVLVRYPHAGPFESPELVVNNKNKEAIAMMTKHPKDAVGINHNIAEKLSGADFDGDTVTVIPNDEGKVKVRKSLEGLKNFDPGSYYPAYEGMTKVGPKREDGEDGFNKGREMGSVSNLITDMTIKGANDSEIARAVRYSMVVIDAEKHQYNWKGAYQSENIAELKQKYQGGIRAGASTIISKASSQANIPQLSLRTEIDPKTGELIRYETGNTYFKKNSKGDWVETPKLTKSSKMTEAFARGGSAYDLVSDKTNPVEKEYADYANRMHALAVEARKESTKQPPIKQSRSAKTTYSAEVESLNNKVTESKKGAAYEKQVQIMANQIVSSAKKDRPDMTKEEIKKVKDQALKASRNMVTGGKSASRIETITPKEWEAIQAGAVSNSTLNYILNHANMDQIRSYATPKSDNLKLSSSQIAALKTKFNSGKYSASELASSYGISVSTLYNLMPDKREKSAKND